MGTLSINYYQGGLGTRCVMDSETNPTIYMDATLVTFGYDDDGGNLEACEKHAAGLLRKLYSVLEYNYEDEDWDFDDDLCNKIIREYPEWNGG